jgi:hypothetical protein
MPDSVGPPLQLGGSTDVSQEFSSDGWLDITSTCHWFPSGPAESNTQCLKKQQPVLRNEKTILFSVFFIFFSLFICDSLRIFGFGTDLLCNSS